MNATQIRDVQHAPSDSKSLPNPDMLRMLINHKGMTVAELAHLSGVHKSTIFRILGGGVGGRGATIRALARALDTTVETLYAR